jgi:preprotein translocase subunit SecF
MGSRWTAREVAIGAAVGCFVIAGLSVDLTLALLFGLAGISIYMFLRFGDK